MTLYFYIARRFVGRFLAIFGSFFALAFLMETTALFGRFDSAGLGMLDTLRLALLKSPTGVYQMLSMVIILAALLLFRGLSRSSELVATRAAGLSGLRMVAPPMLAAWLIGLIGVTAFNPMAAAALRQFETETGRYNSGSMSAFSLSREGLWLRQGNDQGQTVIFAERANFDATRLSGVTFFEFDASGVAQRRIETGYARLADGAWSLGPGKFWLVNARGKVPDQAAETFDSLSLPSDLSSDQILDSFGDPTTISIWYMRSFIDRLASSGFSTARHQVYLQSELASPLLLAAMVLIGAGFSMRHHRSGRTGQMVLMAVITGLAVFILQDFAQILGANGAIPVAAAAWGPPVSAMLLGVGLLLHMEDG